MLIAKIISSNSHIDYAARVVDEFDASDHPGPADYRFGTFVWMPALDGGRIVGVVYNSMLVNPEFASYGPRLSPKPDAGNFTPDYLNEQGVLLGILLIGSIGPEGTPDQDVPGQVVQAGEPVHLLGAEDFRAFHREIGGALCLKYYPQIVAHTGAFAVPLLQSIISRLRTEAENEDLRKLEVLRQNLSWQRTVGAPGK